MVTLASLRFYISACIRSIDFDRISQISRSVNKKTRAAVNAARVIGLQVKRLRLALRFVRHDDIAAFDRLIVAINPRGGIVIYRLRSVELQ